MILIITLHGRRCENILFNFRETTAINACRVICRQRECKSLLRLGFFDILLIIIKYNALIRK